MDNNELKKNDPTKNNYKIDKMTILLILILFTFYDKLSSILWNIGKSLIYIILFLYGLSYLNKPFADKIKKILGEFINISSNSFIKDTASTVSKGIGNLIKTSITSKSNIESLNNISISDPDLEKNRNIYNSSFSTTRKLSNNYT